MLLIRTMLTKTFKAVTYTYSYDVISTGRDNRDHVVHCKMRILRF